MMRAALPSCLIALGAVAIVAAITAIWLPAIGLASAALLFLLPVLLVSARGGLGPGLFAAGAGAIAYNFFLLPPRFTFRIHAPENAVSVVVLFAVAFVTSRLATALARREAEAMVQVAASAEAAALSGILSKGDPGRAIDEAIAFVGEHYGPVRIVPQDALPEDDSAFSTLDLSAAAWAMHNGDITGHGTAIMPAAEWTFLPLAPRRQQGSDLAAVARPSSGVTRSDAELARLQGLIRLIGQASDRLALDEERRARERLEDRDALRRALLASLAHDFRTPLTVITGELDAIGKDVPGVTRALAETQRLDRMMDDLIGAARIESGALVPRMEAVDLVDVVGAACDALSLRDGQVALWRNIPADLPLVTTDPVLLRHILVNLLDNAARHASTAVTISAVLDGASLRLTIADDGPGVAPEERARIFDRFTRAEGSDRRGGSGLGLAIVKGFADALHMEVSVSDRPGGGACFALLVPLGDDQRP
jgi:two-component system sensor histidine kinase KdpD